MKARRLGVLAALLMLAPPAAVAGADSFEPVRLSIKIAPVARRHAKLRVSVQVSADPGVLDARTAPLRMRVKVSSECGGTFSSTPGTVLLDKRLKPQPTTGHAYSTRARGAGKPSSFGVKTVCAFLDEEGDQRTFASDQSLQVNVSRACTRKASRYDASRRALRRAVRRGAGAARARRRARGARRAARAACGPGVRL